MDRKRSTDSGHGAGAVATEWVALVLVVALLTVWATGWVSDALAQAARDTGKRIENNFPKDR